jgi:hypothetical protein
MPYPGLASTVLYPLSPDCNEGSGEPDHLMEPKVSEHCLPPGLRWAGRHGVISKGPLVALLGPKSLVHLGAYEQVFVEEDGL